MTRILFHGGNLFDGTGADPAPADVVVDGDRIVAVGGPGTGDGDHGVDLDGRTLLPGFFDCHVHVLFSGIDILRDLQTPFSFRFFLAAANLGRRCGPASRACATRRAPTPGCSMAVERRPRAPAPACRSRIDMLSQTGGHGDEHFPCGVRRPAAAARRTRACRRCIVDGARRDAAHGARADPGGADVLKVATERRRAAASGATRGVPTSGRRSWPSSSRRPPPPAGPSWPMPRPRDGHQERGASRRPLDRARHLPRRRGDRLDAGAGHVAGADAHRADLGARVRRCRRPDLRRLDSQGSRQSVEIHAGLRGAGPSPPV